MKFENVIIMDNTDPKCQDNLEGDGTAVEVESKLPKKSSWKRFRLVIECLELKKHSGCVHLGLSSLIHHGGDWYHVFGSIARTVE